jgi:hypothetical protein|tara:strand:- start:128 stop:340 length:213 start_codon:yes stop_codon:yes gene_type:complete
VHSSLLKKPIGLTQNLVAGLSVNLLAINVNPIAVLMAISIEAAFVITENAGDLLQAGAAGVGHQNFGSWG